MLATTLSSPPPPIPPYWRRQITFHIASPVHWGVFSVPSFKSEWYWHELMAGNPEYVEFHNSVYGCSGVMTNQFPCNGSTFSYVRHVGVFVGGGSTYVKYTYPPTSVGTLTLDQCSRRNCLTRTSGPVLSRPQEQSVS